MPRSTSVQNTRIKKEKSTPAVVATESIVNNQSKNETNDMKKSWLKQVEQEIENQKLKLYTEYEEIMQQIETISFLKQSTLSPEIKNKTLGELKLDKTSISISELSNIVSASTLEILNRSKNGSVARNKAQNLSNKDGSRSSSCDSARRRFAKSSTRKRPSRSVSRSNMLKHVSIHASVNTETPAKSVMPKSAAFGFVTPKVKPNSGLSLLRRPKQGEMAISMHGSPLLVSGVVTESCANVNIPLQDGKIVSLQPTHGILASQIPILNEDTKKQLLTLRDNLNKIVSLSQNM